MCVPTLLPLVPLLGQCNPMPWEDNALGVSAIFNSSLQVK